MPCCKSSQIFNIPSTVSREYLNIYKHNFNKDESAFRVESSIKEHGDRSSHFHFIEPLNSNLRVRDSTSRTPKNK